MIYSPRERPVRPPTDPSPSVDVIVAVTWCVASGTSLLLGGLIVSIQAHDRSRVLVWSFLVLAAVTLLSIALARFRRRLLSAPEGTLQRKFADRPWLFALAACLCLGTFFLMLQGLLLLYASWFCY